MAKRLPHKRRFYISINELAFFHEPWLCDRDYGGEDYRYDNIPPAIFLEFLEEIKASGIINPEEARLVIDFALKQARSLKAKQADHNRFDAGSTPAGPTKKKEVS